MEQVRELGNILEILGFAVVAWDYHAAYMRYRERPTLWQRLTKPLSDWYGRHFTEPRNITLDVHSAVSISSAMSARVTVTPGNLETIDRVAAEVMRLGEQHDRDIAAVHDAIGEVRTEREQAIKQVTEDVRRVEEKLERTAEAIEVGDPTVRIGGFVCVSFGLVLSTWPQVFADFGLLVGLAWATAVMWTLRRFASTGARS